MASVDRYIDVRAVWIGRMRERLTEWVRIAQRRDQVRNSRTLLVALLLVSAHLLPALYRSYFVALRNAIVTALEGLAIERLEIAPRMTVGLGMATGMNDLQDLS